MGCIHSSEVHRRGHLGSGMGIWIVDSLWWLHWFILFLHPLWYSLWCRKRTSQATRPKSQGAEESIACSIPNVGHCCSVNGRDRQHPARMPGCGQFDGCSWFKKFTSAAKEMYRWAWVEPPMSVTGVADNQAKQMHRSCTCFAMFCVGQQLGKVA